VGGLLDDLKHVLRERFDAYVATKAAHHVVRREREQLERVDAKLDRFAARIEAALTAGEARIESLRRLEDELRTLLAELRLRTDELRITGMDELLELIDSLRNLGSARAEATEVTVSSAIRRLAGEPEPGVEPARPDEDGRHAPRAGPDVPEPPAPPAPAPPSPAPPAATPAAPISVGEVEAWRPDPDMRLIEVDVDRDTP